MKLRNLLAVVLAFAMLAAACGGSDDDGSGDSASGSCDEVVTKTDGVLTVATGETVFPPWMGAGENDFDDPEDPCAVSVHRVLFVGIDP